MAQNLGWQSEILCLTQGEAGQDFRLRKRQPLPAARREELERAAGILGVSRLTRWGYPDGKLREARDAWVGRVTDFLAETEPGIVVSFDHSGVTGHPDHIVTSVEVLRVIRDMAKRPALLWHLPIGPFRNRFKNSGTLDLLPRPTHKLDLGWGRTVKKLAAILSHWSQFSLERKLGIVAAHLVERKELYHKVDFRKRYEHRFVEFEI